MNYELLCILLGVILFLISLNPISKLAYVIFSFFSTGLLFINLDYSFLGISYIIVYVGAIAILFLFVIMLVPTSLFFDNNIKINLFIPFFFILLSSIILSYIFNLLNTLNSFPLLHQLNWFINYFEITNIMNFAFYFFHSYLLIIIFLAIILWIVLIGVLTISL